MMSAAPLTESQAFRSAALDSERRRAFAVVLIVGLLVVMFLVRNIGNELDPRVQAVGLVGLSMLILVQLAVFWMIRRSRRQNNGLPLWFSISTVVIESFIPTGMIAANIKDEALSPSASLTSPPILAYGLVLTLAALRLRPVLCLLAGAVCALGYAGVTVLASQMEVLGARSGSLPTAAYVSATVLIFMTGASAAWVTWEIRRHLESALGEAEARRRADRMEQDLSVAQSIQQALLPDCPPSIAGYDVAGWNRPADQTGGDYYDWQQLSDQRWIVTLADVSGHGIGPALVTAACRAYVRASAQHQADLSSLANYINRLLCDDLPDGRFITMASVLLRAGDDRVALLSAGHGPIVLFASARGSVDSLAAHGLPLAVEADIPFGSAQVLDMKPGDVLALATDGFSEWARVGPQGRREEFGVERLRSALMRNATLDAAGIVKAITAEVTAFVDPAPQQDDLTIVVIKRSDAES